MIVKGDHILTITLELNDKQIALLNSLYQEYKRDNPISPYVLYMYQPQDCVITVYNSKKVVFQGNQADYYASLFKDNELYSNHAGSDEVGTGDFYGPICVCACIVGDNDEMFLNSLGIRDSKMLSDSQIMIIAPKLIKKLKHSLLILDNLKYNQVHHTNNMNVIKAKMHNQAYINLAKKQTLPKLIVIDQFTPKKNYFNYLKDEPKVIKDILFITKAESKYTAVACASIIARYAFLESLKKMEEHYQWYFPKGAGKIVDENAKAFVNKFGKDKLKLVAKMNFKNTIRVLNET